MKFIEFLNLVLNKKSYMRVFFRVAMSNLALCCLPEHLLQCICQYLTKSFVVGDQDPVSDIVSLMMTCSDLYAIIKRLQLRCKLQIVEAFAATQSWGSETSGIEKTVESIIALKNNPQWMIIKLQLNVYSYEAILTPISFNRIYKILEALDVNLRDNLECVVLLISLNAKMDSDLDPLVEMARYLASYNKRIEFHIVHCRIDLFAENFYEKLSKCVAVKSVHFRMNAPDWFRYLKTLDQLNQVVEAHDSGPLNIADVRHLQNLCDLHIESLNFGKPEFVAFNLPNLKNLHLYNQNDISEQLGAFISRVFPNLESIAVFSRKLAAKPEEIGLDKLPSCCSTLAINYKMLSTRIKLISNQFSHLSLEVTDFEDLNFCLLEKMVFHYLKALTVFGNFEGVTERSFSLCLDLITRVIRWQPKLQVLAVSTEFSLDDLEIENGAELILLVSWLGQNEELFEASDIKFISFGEKVIHMKNSLDLKTVRMMKYLNAVRWDLGTTNLLKSKQSIPMRYSQLNCEK